MGSKSQGFRLAPKAPEVPDETSVVLNFNGWIEGSSPAGAGYNIQAASYRGFRPRLGHDYPGFLRRFPAPDSRKGQMLTQFSVSLLPLQVGEVGMVTYKDDVRDEPQDTAVLLNIAGSLIDTIPVQEWRFLTDTIRDLRSFNKDHKSGSKKYTRGEIIQAQRSFERLLEIDPRNAEYSLEDFDWQAVMDETIGIAVDVRNALEIGRKMTKHRKSQRAKRRHQR